jgi:hypothetical protein
VRPLVCNDTYPWISANGFHECDPSYETRERDHTTRRQTNLLQDGIGRYFRIELAAISFFLHSADIADNGSGAHAVLLVPATGSPRLKRRGRSLVR